jgi:ABC-type transport system substrate-binding protein
MLVEFTSTGAEGGQYACPVGQLERTDIGRRLIFRLKRGIKASADGDHLTGFDLARQLLALADPRQIGFDPTWADLRGGVSVQDVYQVDAELRWSYVQPLALLETPVAPLKAGAAPQGIGPYLLGDNVEGKTHFSANRDYFAQQPGQLSEIVEQYVPNSQAAWTSMERGQVHLIDRLAPWEIERYGASRDYAVGQYALPTIHCLMPNLDRPFTKNKYFRRAIAYAIDRDLVLKHHLLKDETLPGYQLVSGPFPIGNGFEDPLRYAYNNEVAQRQRNPRLALTLSEVALKEINEAAKKREEPEIKEFPRLKIAHPPNDIAREACKGIKRHIEGLKFKVDLRELEPGISVPSDGNYDLLYLEMTVQEPLVDAARLLGPDGIVGEASPFMTQHLVHLAKAINWQEARQILQSIHRQTDEDMAIIPLWQMNEYFAYHRSLKGIDASPVLLYQSVENWKSSPRVPEEDY